MRPPPGPASSDELPLYALGAEPGRERAVSPAGGLVLLGVLIAIIVVPTLSGSETTAEPPMAGVVIHDQPTVADPVEHSGPEAFLAGAPGPGSAVVPGVSGASLLYAGTRGRPVLVSLDTGHRRELVIGEDWRWFRFMVERGEIVVDEASEHTWPRAGDHAIEVVAVRTGRVGSGASVIELCVQGHCEPPPPGDPISLGGDTARLLDARIDPAVAELFDPEIWVRDGRWILSPASSELDLRLPAAASGSPIWLIDQPVA